MTKKHFEAMADYVAATRREISEKCDKIGAAERSEACYNFALYLCNKFGTNFDRVKFDAWIEKRSKV